MESIIFLLGVITGIGIGYSYIPRAKQKTKITVTDAEVTFESNRLQNGDKYEVYRNDRLVSSGVVKNNEWSH